MLNKSCIECGNTKFFIIDTSFAKDGLYNLQKTSECTNCNRKEVIISFPYPVAMQQKQPQVQSCAFDGLKPGTYGLVCNCPRCSVTC